MSRTPEGTSPGAADNSTLRPVRRIDADSLREQWLVAFTLKLQSLGVRGDPHFIGDIACQLHPSQNHLDPGDVAQSQWDEWPPSGR